VAERSFTPSSSDRAPVAIDSTVAHTSRVYDYLLGGTDNFAVDREVAEHAFAAYPGGTDGARTDARANRAFLGRCVRYLAGEAGVRQFLDVGTGIPTADNIHAVAQATAPEARVVYVDNDPIVLAHAHALLVGTDVGRTAFVEGDLRSPDAILERAAETLDPDQPVALVMIGLLHVVPDRDEPHRLVRALLDGLAPGSYLALSHMTNELQPDAMDEVLERLDRTMRTTNPPAFRSREQIERFFDGLQPVAPGVVHLDQWRPDETTPVANGHGRISPLYCGVARVPENLVS
jgi:SAM-dependent methyltransferase